MRRGRGAIPYRGLVAKRDGVGNCGHDVKVGDTIGWHGPTRTVLCPACWAQREYQQRSAWAYEETGSDCSYDY